METNRQRLLTVIREVLKDESELFTVEEAHTVLSSDGSMYLHMLQFRSVHNVPDGEDFDDESLYSMTVWIGNDGNRLSCDYDMDIHWGFSNMTPSAWFTNEYAMAPWLEGVIAEYRRSITE